MASKRKAGRPPITEVYMSAEEIVAHYKKTKSMRKTAKELGLGLVTVSKYVNELKASFPVGGEMRLVSLEELNSRPVAKAFAQLKGPIPHKIVAVHKLMPKEFSLNVVQHFIQLRHKLVLMEIRKWGSLLDHPNVHLRDIYGRIIRVGMFSDYTITVDRYTLVVTIHATLNFGGRVTCHLAFNALRDILQIGDNAPQINA